MVRRGYVHWIVALFALVVLVGRSGAVSPVAGQATEAPTVSVGTDAAPPTFGPGSFNIAV
jgi:hypothetical protein